MEKLLSRQEFVRACFERDRYRCVICGRHGDSIKLDAHHIIERRLWDDGGYYLSNAATLCDQGELGCHYKAETTALSVEDIRIACGITKPMIPEDMYSDVVYDKWGNTILENGRRTKGPLFFDESVQKVIAPFLGDFTDEVKYPRTYHLPWSEGVSDDDRVLKDLSHFVGKRVIVTEKMDGENFNGYRGKCHARSVDGRSHYTRDYAKGIWLPKSYDLPEEWRVCCENLYAVHSIKYTNLPSYLMGFSIWNERNECLDWDETALWFNLLDIPLVPVLFEGIWDEAAIRGLWAKMDREAQEGYVVRLADSFKFGDFRKSVAKFVRANHVTSANHGWRHRNDHPTNELGVMS